MIRNAILSLSLVACLLPLTAYGEDESAVYPVGVENYNVINLSGPANMPACVINSIKTIDLNEDGLTDILFTFTEKGKDGNYAGVAFQKHGSNAAPFGEVPDQSLAIDRNACMLSAGNYDAQSKGKEIIFFWPKGVSYYKLTDTLRYDPNPCLLVQTPTLFQHPLSTSDTIPFSSALGGQDINNDGLDDLFVPTADNYALFTGNKRPAFRFCTGTQSINTAPLDFVTLSASLPNIILEDLNGDGLKDVIAYDGEALSFYIQPFDSKPGRFRLKFLAGTGDIDFRSVYFADLNRDKISDLVIASTGGNMDADLKTRIFIFTGGLDNSGALGYPETPAQIINIKGIAPSLRLADINGDGCLDLFVTSFKANFGSNIKKALLRYAVITYQAYFYMPGKGISVTPSYERTINFPMNALGRGQFSHIYMEYDFNGDGVLDIMTIAGPDRKNCTLFIYPGIPKDELMKKNSVGFRKDEYLLYPLRIPDKVIIEDINNDRKCDIILQYKSRMTMLISK